MIARVADHCFWLGRYLERTECTARVLSVTNNLALDGEVPPRAAWLPVIVVSGEGPRFSIRFGQKGAGDGEVVQRYMTWDDENPSSLKSSIGSARENARSIREVVSLECWETINELYLWCAGERAKSQYTENRFGFFTRIRRSAALCLGLFPHSMLHEQPLHFIVLGMLLERAGQTARVLDVHHHALSGGNGGHGDVETALWLAILRICMGFEPFMKKNHGVVTGRAAAGFLLLEPRFPRSVRHCVRSATESLSQIRPPDREELPGGQTLERLAALDRWLEAQSMDAVDGGAIHEVLTRVVDETAAICEGLGRELFGYAPRAGAENQ